MGLPGHADLRLQSVYRASAPGDLETFQKDTHIMIDGKGIHVTVGTAHTDIVWDKIRRISKKPDMLVIFSDTTHGYVLTDRVLGGDREAVYSFITARMNHGKK